MHIWLHSLYWNVELLISELLLEIMSKNNQNVTKYFHYYWEVNGHLKRQN